MQIGDAILHPRYGVGVIESIEKRMCDGVIRDFFVIPKKSISSIIYVPVDAAEEHGLRPLTTVENLNQVVRILSGEADNENLCTEEHTINWHNPIDLARVIRNGIVEPYSRYPRTTQKHQLEHAKKLLAEELSAVLGMSDESINVLVDNKAKRTTVSRA
jgi:RNA polymerase-interacting CarD/CdnL/TRCF family regulator